MAHHRLVPDRAIVSTSTRTRETWELAAAAFPRPVPVAYERRLYEAAPQTILNVIKETDRTVTRLLVIGHNPGLHSLAMALIASGDLDARERLSEALPTTGLVTIDFPIDDWEKLHLQSGRLGPFITPRSLKMATD